MIDYQQYCQIKDYQANHHLTAAQIARELHLDERTVAKWLAQAKFSQRPTVPRPSKLDAFKPQIVRWLAHHPYTATQVFLRLGESGYTGGPHDRQGLCPPRASAAYAGLPDLGVCPRRMRPGGLGPVRRDQRRQHPPPPELLCHGAVLQPHAVCPVHALRDHGALPGLPHCRLQFFWRYSRQMHGRQLEVRGAAPGRRRSACVEPAVQRLRPTITALPSRPAAWPSPKRRDAWRMPWAMSKRTSWPVWNSMTLPWSIRPPASGWTRWPTSVSTAAPNANPSNSSRSNNPPSNPYHRGHTMSGSSCRCEPTASFRVTLDTNTYSVPAECAGAQLTLKVYPDHLCIYQQEKLLARHDRSYDRHQDFENPDHPRALLQQRPPRQRSEAAPATPGPDPQG